MRRVRCLGEILDLQAQRKKTIALKRLEGMRAVHEYFTRDTAICWVCKGTEDLGWSRRWTQYPWDGLRGLDPNAPMILCTKCNDEYNEHWMDMWSEYYSSIL